MTSDNSCLERAKPCCQIKECISNAVKKTKETYYECDFDMCEKIHSGNSENPEIGKFKNGNIKIRLFDVIVGMTVIGTIIAAVKLICD